VFELSKFDGARLAGVLAAASAVLAGCDQNNGWQGSSNAARVCVDRENNRVPEAQCAAVHPGGVNPFFWYYVGRMASGGVPGYGGHVGGGSFSPMSGVSYGAAPASGIARGGFGGTGGGEGGAGE
jgi:hypothetical protein